MNLFDYYGSLLSLSLSFLLKHFDEELVSFHLSLPLSSFETFRKGIGFFPSHFRHTSASTQMHGINCLLIT